LTGLLLFILPTNIGDFVLSSPVINHFIKKYPDHKYIVVAGQAPLVLIKWYDRIYKTFPAENYKGLEGKLCLYKELKKYSYEIIVDLRHTLFPIFLKAKKKYYRFSKGKSHVLLEHLKVLGKDRPKHFPGYPIFYSSKDISDIKKLLAPFKDNNKSLIIGLNPDANWEHKRWDAENWIKLINSLSKKYPEVCFVSIGINKIIEYNSSNFLDLTNKLSLTGLAALLSRLDLFITNDSGPMHLSVSVNTPTLGIFGPSLPEKYAPFGKRHAFYKNTSICDKCFLTECNKDFYCLKNTSPDIIAELADRLIEKNNIKI